LLEALERVSARFRFAARQEPILRVERIDMSHVARSLVWSAGFLLVACAACPAVASDYAELAGNPLRGESGAAEVNPRYFNQGENAPRALDAGAPRELDASGPSPMPIRPLPISTPHAERAASGTDEAAMDVPGEPQLVVAAAQPLPLAPPSNDARAGFRAGELPALVTGAASLGIVLGLFLLVVWVVRRGMPKNASLLPREAVEMLGRAALVGRQQVHLLRCGNKILLLSVSPTSVETLTEITDPEEVDRLAGICQQGSLRGATSSFRQIFQQFGGEPRDAHQFAEQAEQDAEELDFAHLESSHHRGRELRA
jgi:flagellar biogenesis protein FliO